MDAYQLRLECLRLAHEPGASPNDIVDRARSYSDFIFGRRDAEVLRAANELAKAVSQCSTE